MRRVPIEVIPRVPDPVRKVARTAVWTTGRLTARWRELPDFLVIGAQKAGTTALYAYLRWHPSIAGPFWKEVSFFDRHWARGEAWYRGQFPLRSSGKLVGEASPSYVFHPLAPERVFSLVPDVKLVVLLREPGDRAYSQYQHAVALGRETLSFEDALAAEDERVRGEVERLRADQRHSALRGGTTRTRLVAFTPTSSTAGSRSSRASSFSWSPQRSSAPGPKRRTRRCSRSSVRRHMRSMRTRGCSTATTRRCERRRVTR